MSTPLHRRLRLQIIQLFKVCFYSLAYGQEYCLIMWLFDSSASHSLVAASCVKELGLKFETLEE